MRQARFTKCRRIKTQLVGDNLIRNLSLLFQEFPHKFKGRSLVLTRLSQGFKDLAFIVQLRDPGKRLSF